MNKGEAILWTIAGILLPAGIIGWSIVNIKKGLKETEETIENM